MLFLDTETTGLVGPVITIQHSLNDGPVHIHHVWKETVGSTRRLIEEICNEVVVAYNLPFDWFHLVRIYNLFLYLPDDDIPDPNTVASLERLTVQSNDGRHCRVFLKPKGAIDLLLHARSGPLQKLMVTQKDCITIKRIPEICAKALIPLLPQPGADIDGIYFHRISRPGWVIRPLKKGLCDLILRFRPSMGLKPVVNYLLQKPVITDGVPKHLMPEYNDEWKPWGWGWEVWVPGLVNYWATNQRALQYASEDVNHLQSLYNFWQPHVDTNSWLAISVANTRWRGMSVDRDRLRELKDHYLSVAGSIPVSPAAAKRYILEPESKFAAARLPDTKGSTLERFNSERSNAVLRARQAHKRLEILGKLERSVRFFPSFTIIGTKSNRMAGTGKLNPQGLPHDPEFRALFACVSGGDYSSFEVGIAAADYNDDQLNADLAAGLSYHGLFGAEVYNKPYEEIIADKDIYHRSKTGAFASFYGAQEFKLAETLRIEEAEAKQALTRLGKKYPGIQRKRTEMMRKFCSVVQPGGIGTRVEWNEPAEYEESLLGFRRYYTLENHVLKLLFQLAEYPRLLEEFNDITVTRRDREQLLPNAVRSALFACIFTLQQRNVRSAGNHRIQSTGAGICKELQRSIWEHQPQGVHPPVVSMMNVHDEIVMIDCNVDLTDTITSHLQEYRKVVPLLKIVWKNGLQHWGQK